MRNLAVCGIGCVSLVLAIQPVEPTLLEPGRTVEQHLAAKESQEFQIALRKGEYAKLVVEQRSIRVKQACFSPDGKLLFEDETFAIGEPQNSEFIANASGRYRFRLTSSDPTAPAGQFAITLESVEPATSRHQNRVAAIRAYSAVTKIENPGSPQFRQTVIAAYRDALTNWRAAGDLREEARTLYSLGPFLAFTGERQKGLELTTQGLAVARSSGDRRFEAWALHMLGEIHTNFGDKRKAIEYAEQSLPLMQATRDRAGEAIVLNSLAVGYAQTGEKRKALPVFEQSVAIMRELHDRARVATAESNIGVTYSDLGEYRRALERYQSALALFREMGNRAGEALALNNIGTAYSDLAEYQKALDAHTAALEINRSVQNRWSVAINLHNIGWVYGSLGDTRRALNNYLEALEFFRGVKAPWNLARTLNNLGETYAALGEERKALEVHKEGLGFRRAAGDADGEATSLTNIGKIYAKLGERENARRHFEQAIGILRRTADPWQLTVALRNLGALDRKSGQYQHAAEHLDEALQASRVIEDRRGEVNTLAELARLERDRGNPIRAHERAEEALAGLEALRLSVASPSLRASFFATAREVQELAVATLIDLHAQQPDKGFDAAALAIVERGRARSLLELLSESGMEIRRGVDAALLERERELEGLISGKAEKQVRLLSGKHSVAEAAAMRKELDSLTADLEQVRSRIRVSSPQYAALMQPAPLSLDEIQSRVLDDDTVLLEYSLGATKSFLWAVTPCSADVFALPASGEIEAAVKSVLELVTSRDEAYLAATARVSNMLLGPAASRLAGKRLMIVADGVLLSLPFSILPEPGAGESPLIVNHEIVTAPSASVMAVLRRETIGRQTGEKSVAILADPVFTPDDARITRRREAAAVRPATDFVRLRFSRHEAEEIARLAAAASTLKALDFDASRETVFGADFGGHRILHFATHSVIDNERPELSGIVLSLYDRSGNRRNGFLRLYEIFNLRLTSDLVVLSACESALGREIRGEGLMGLTRGFLYAGAPRVVASLWKVDDRASAELMKRFYEGMLVRGERPAAALRNAQVAMSRTRGWDAPYYWGAYTLQGEWR